MHNLQIIHEWLPVEPVSKLFYVVYEGEIPLARFEKQYDADWFLQEYASYGH